MRKGLKRKVLIIMGLIVFHIGLSAFMSLIARSSYFLQYHNGQGIWNFAMDSSLYHAEALSLLDFLTQGDYSGWWGSSSFWHVKWIALSYAIFSPDPLSFAPINALAWVMSIICVHQIAGTLFPGNHKLAFFSAIIFGFWPSYLLQTIQLLKDPFYVTGILMMVWGWVSLLTNKKGVVFSLLVAFGVLLAYLNRAYILESLLFLSLLALGLVLWRSRRSWAFALLAFILVCGLSMYALGRQGLNKQYVQIQDKTHAQIQAEGRSSRLLEWLKGRAQGIMHERDGYIAIYPNAGSNIDTDVRFFTFTDIIAYIPRAALIGFLAPFPSHWFEDAKTAGRPSRIFAGFEMLMWYLLMIGFLYCLATGSVGLQVRIWLVVFSVSLVILTSLVVTNIGALFRMRFVYFLPILFGGLEGWIRYSRSRK